ncbi:hypothetical protein HAX54_044043 [Datura stramonium]|uniref:Uncharacterized protein n=1 Tax=Datura stramonium TaxID=4076 RepID=A0ABS8SNT9_DATST|nr:hypothetical protein [Datura stramonium]
MTAPSITTSSEKIEMTAPVITKSGDRENNTVTMQFILLTKYMKFEEAPKPLDERVVVKEEGERKYEGVAEEKEMVVHRSKRKEKEREGCESDGKEKKVALWWFLIGIVRRRG